MRPGFPILLAVVCLSQSLFTSTAKAVTFDDIEFWVGSGPNQTAFVLDWNDGRPALLWGYQWEGVTSAKTMFHDVVAADPRLFGKVSNQFSFGEFIYGIGYDRDGDGFALSDGTVFTQGLFDGPATDGAFSLDADDSYMEGFNSGFWAYYIAAGNPYAGGAWEESQFGLGDTILTDGGFQGIRFAPGFASGPPVDEPVPATGAVGVVSVPEPGMVVMLGMGVMGLMLRRR